jgi:hypothetical protein
VVEISEILGKGRKLTMNADQLDQLVDRLVEEKFKPVRDLLQGLNEIWSTAPERIPFIRAMQMIAIEASKIAADANEQVLTYTARHQRMQDHAEILSKTPDGEVLGMDQEADAELGEFIDRIIPEGNSHERMIVIKTVAAILK